MIDERFIYNEDSGDFFSYCDRIFENAPSDLKERFEYFLDAKSFIYNEYNPKQLRKLSDNGELSKYSEHVEFLRVLTAYDQINNEIDTVGKRIEVYGKAGLLNDKEKNSFDNKNLENSEKLKLPRLQKASALVITYLEEVRLNNKKSPNEKYELLNNLSDLSKAIFEWIPEYQNSEESHIKQESIRQLFYQNANIRALHASIMDDLSEAVYPKK